MTAHILTIGTRKSPLARAQATQVRDHLSALHGWSSAHLSLLPLQTTGDRLQDRALKEMGGKGLFTKELDQALLEGRIDIAVHSAKDLPTLIPKGIRIAGYLKREDPRDAFIAHSARHPLDLPQGACFGTASLRREAQMLRLRPDVRPMLLRGNVETRLRKVQNGEMDATFLALAGLKRLGLAHHATALLSVDEFLPAVGQGAIALLIREEDIKCEAYLSPLCDACTEIALKAERAFLHHLDGSCRTPIAGYAFVQADHVSFRGQLLSEDGGYAWEAHGEGPLEQASQIGWRAAEDILCQRG